MYMYIHRYVGIDVMYDRRHASSAKSVANPNMYYFKGMKCLSFMPNTQSDLIDIEL